RLVVVARRLGQLFFEVVFVFVFDEGHGIVVVIVKNVVVVVAVGRAHAGGVGAGLAVVVVRRQDRLVASLVDLGRGAFDVLGTLFGVGGRVGDLVFGRVVSGGAWAATRAAAADGFFHRVGLGVALGATGRATVQIVEVGLAVRADLLLAQFGI